MPAAPRIFSLNLGSQTVGLAEFRTQAQGGLVLVGYALREILAEAGNETARNLQIAAALREMMAELQVKTGVGELLRGRAIGLRAFRETALGGRGKNRTHHRFRSAAECAVSDRGSGLGLSARRQQFGCGIASRAGRDQERFARRNQRRGRGNGLAHNGGRCGHDGALQRLSLQLQRPDRLLAPGRSRGAHDQSPFYRTGESFLAQRADWRRLHFRRARERIQRAGRGRGVPEASRWIR